MLFPDSCMHSMAPVLGGLWWNVFTLPPHSILLVLLGLAPPAPVPKITHTLAALNGHNLLVANMILQKKEDNVTPPSLVYK